MESQPIVPGAQAVRILHLEDDAAFADLVRAQLGRIGAATVALERVATLADAQARLAQSAFDLVITDLNVPDSSGLATVASLAGSGERPVIVLTGESEPRLREAALERGAYDLIQKDLLSAAELNRLVRLASLQASVFRAGQESLRLAELEYRSIFENAVEGIYRVDARGRVTNANAALARMLGFESPEEMMSRIADVAHEVYVRSADRARFRDLVQGSELVSGFETQWRRRDGSTMWVSLSARRLVDPRTGERYHLGTAVDISAHVAAQEDLRRFRLAMDHSGDIIVLIDRAAMRFVDVNATACRLMGYSREELLSMGPQDVLPVSRRALEQSYDALIADPAVVGKMNSYYRCKDGSQLPFESTRHVLRSGGNWFIAAISRDIRERLSAEHALRASEERFRALTELSSDMFWQQDAEHRFTSISGHIPGHLRAGRLQQLGKRRWETAYFNMDEAAWAAHRAELDARQPFRDLELGRFNESGERVWVSVSGTPVYDEAGAFAGYHGVGKDITARKREERLLGLEHEVAGLLAQTKAVPDALWAVMRSICESENWECARYFGLDPRAGVMRFQESWIAAGAGLESFIAGSAGLSFACGEGLVGAAWQAREALWVEDARRDRRIAQKRLARLAGAHGVLVVPIAFESNVIGVLSITSTRVRRPDERLLRTLGQIGAQLGQYLMRKQTELALAESEARFRQTFELAASGISHVGLDGRFLKVNRACCEMLGYTEAELLGLTVEQLSHPEDRAVSRPHLRCLRAGEVDAVRFEKRYVRKDGTAFWASVSVAAVRDAQGRTLHEISVIEDITERKLADERTRQSEERFRSLTEISTDWYWELDADLRIVDMQGPALPYDREAVRGLRPEELPGVDESDPTWIEYRRRTAERSAFRYLTFTVALGGERHFFTVSGQPIFDASGVFRGYWGTGRDISTQLRRDADLTRFRTALDSSADMVMLVQIEPQPRLVDFNETACFYLGYERGELLGRSPTLFLADLSEDALALSHSGLLGRPDRSDLLVRTYRRKDGSLFEVEVLRRIVDSPDGPILVINARDLTERRRSERRQALHLRYQEATARFAQAALGRREASELVEDAVRAVHEALEVPAVVYLGRDAEPGTLAVQGARGLEGVHGLHDTCPDLLLRLSGAAPILGADTLRRVLPFAWAARFQGAAVARVQGDGAPCGALCALSESADAFGPEESRFLEAAGSVLSSGLRRIESEGRLAFLAQFDALTGLPNRALLADRFAQLIVQARRHDKALGVLFIDLDGFKLVNDSLGHAAGDDLLKETGRRLQGCVRPGDTVARISGDEFAVILNDLAKPEDAALVAQKMIERLAAPLHLAGSEAFVTASIGIATFPSDGDDAEVLLGAADAAMYRAKQSGRNGYQFFTNEINQRTRIRAQLGAELRRALERGEFRLFYQPKVDLRTRAPGGCEALLRWQHPERGLVSPAEFIPVLEETGLIVAVGEWVLRRACEDIRAWREQGLPRVPVAVNLSARQFRQSDLHERILAIVQAAGIEPGLLELEITESQLMHDPDHAIRTMRALSEAGIRIAIDDFGTGYSSLAYLNRFPVTSLKIDRSFVADVLTDESDAAIVRTIVDMAKTLGFTVVAEGVEQQAQASFLLGLGCDQAQGFLYARPMPAAELAAHLREERAAARRRSIKIAI